jgi:lysophospholipase L1-like esterase
MMDSVYEGESAYRVLCFGDSNTWGYEAGSGRRFAEGRRWPGVLASALGAGFRVLEDGYCGRTTVFEDPVVPGRRGIVALASALESQRPLGLVIIMLGTNDLKTMFSAPAESISRGAAKLVELVAATPAAGLGGKAPRVLLVAPPPILEAGSFAEVFEGGAAKSRLLPAKLAAVAESHGADFFDSGSVAVSNPLDGIHLGLESHEKLGLALADRVRAIARR